MQFRNQVETMETEEWITFRGTLYKYGDLIHSYIENVKNIQIPDTASRFFKDMLNESQESLALLRCITG